MESDEKAPMKPDVNAYVITSSGVEKQTNTTGIEMKIPELN